MTAPLPLRFLRNFTVEPIAPYLRQAFAAAGIECVVEFGGFSTAAAELAAGDAGDGGITVLALGLEQVGTRYGHVDWPAQDVCDEIYALAAEAVASWRSTLVINTVLAPLADPWGLTEPPAAPRAATAVAELNLRLRQLAATAPGRVVLCDWEGYARRLGESGTYDYRFWYSSGAPFAPAFLRLYAQDLARVARVLRGRQRKCLVLDCDNTLWGGIVGEDGVDGIALSASITPGRYFHEFQRAVLDLHARGVVLAIASKNNEADVWEVFDRHPDSLLRRTHFAAWRINWNAKVQSLGELAAELNLGLDSFVLVDDSALECDLVRQALPQVSVLQVPARAEEIPAFLLRENPFEALQLTTADLERADSYRQNRERRSLEQASPDLAGYLQRVQTRLGVRWCTSADLARVAQLLQKTNQFNLTTRRHDLAAVERMAADPDVAIFCASVADRFGDMGLTGVLIARRAGAVAQIDSLLLSCRVLGREVEHAFFAAALTLLRQRWPLQGIAAEYAATAKNGQVADFWLRCGLLPLTADAVAAQYRSDDLDGLIAQNARSFISVES